MVTIKKTINVFCAVFFAVFAVLCVLSLFLPLPKVIGQADMRYRCVWEDGSVSEESYASVYGAIAGAGEQGVILERNGKQGLIAGSKGFREVFLTLCDGTLAELLHLQSDLSAPEKAALMRTFSDHVWYSEGCFVWNGEKIVAKERQSAQTVVLLSGKLKRGFLASSEATSLVVCDRAQVSAEDFVGSAAQTLIARPPYSVSGGALYLQTAGGKRLVAALPHLTSLSVDADTQFIDDGALAPCTQLQSLEVPFAGNMKNPYSFAYSPYLGSLFVPDEEVIAVPSTLERVRVTGGKVFSGAFYGCTSLKEIDLRGVEYIEKNAFLGCDSLLRVRTSVKTEIAGFTQSRDANGYCYERRESVIEYRRNVV